jgi:hypothetical protein
LIALILLLRGYVVPILFVYLGYPPNWGYSLLWISWWSFHVYVLFGKQVLWMLPAIGAFVGRLGFLHSGNHGYLLGRFLSTLPIGVYYVCPGIFDASAGKLLILFNSILIFLTVRLAYIIKRDYREL